MGNDEHARPVIRDFIMDAQSALRKIFTTIVLTASLQGCGGGSDDTGRQSSAAADSTRATLPTAPMPVPANVPPPVTSATTTPAPVAMAIESVAASSGPPGAVLSAHGHGFTRGTRLLWGDQALPAVFQSAMLMTFTLPPTHSGMAVSKTLTAMREDGTSSMAPSLVTVEGVPEPTGMTPTAARTGQLIRITGTGLKLVTRVMVTGIGATIQNIAEDGSWLDFIVPDGAGSGSVALYDARARVYAAGELKIQGAALELRIDDMEIAQSHLHSISQSTVSPYLRLVPLRPLLVRVRLAPEPGVGLVQPEVRLQVTNDRLGTRSLVMQGPETLGATRVAANDLAGSYVTELPGEWVQAGFRLLVEANDRRYPANVTRHSYVPAAGILGQPTYIRLHIVPIQVDSGQTATFDVEALKRNVRGQFPLSDVDFVMEPVLRQPGMSLGNSHEWLNVVTALRAASAPANHDFYLGVLPCGACTGLAYTPGRTAVVSDHWVINGRDHATDGVMLHEIGHNFGRLHTWDDPSFPYWKDGVAGTGGKAMLGGAWAINLLDSRMLRNPALEYDVMSYDYPKGVSDYTYAGAYGYAEQSLPLEAKGRRDAEVFGGAALSQALYLSGTIDSTGMVATLAPVTRMPVAPDTVALAQTVARAELEVEVVDDGGVHRYPLHALTISHADDVSARAFNLTIPALSNIRSIRVMRAGVPLLTRAAEPRGRPPLRAAGVQQEVVKPQWGSYRLGGGVLTINWDTLRWPWIHVWQRVDGRLLPLVLARSGGAVSERVDDRATDFVVSLGDGINSELVHLDRLKHF
ncbi:MULTISPECIES: zinc metalloprotease [unclassified Cupriavidus]|uniref:hypothetical protein n=1 Tax=Cupriavidus sp. H19C3 TaxID=3241603 RepID=UPI003BF872A0